MSACLHNKNGIETNFGAHYNMSSFTAQMSPVHWVRLQTIINVCFQKGQVSKAITERVLNGLAWTWSNIIRRSCEDQA